MSDARIRALLETCYAQIQLGEEPDLTAICAGEENLRAKVARILARERRVVAQASVGEMPLPDTLGDYELRRLIGSGGMGRVYLAVQRSLQRDVALKVLDRTQADSTALLRFEREATTTALLEHPNIVPVYDTGIADGRAYLAMKLIRGPSLDRCGAPLEPRRVAQIGAEIADGLHAAHQAGVLHRDIKPANVLMDRDRPVIVDFGLARNLRGTSLLTEAESLPGTLVYMAPELLEDGAPMLDARIDIYGLGATLYECLVGQPPFQGDFHLQLMRRIMLHDAPAIGLTRSDRDLETIVLRALEKDPRRRFGSAGEMAEELRRYLQGRPIHSLRISPASRLWRRARRHPAVSSLLLAMLLVLSWAIVQQVLDARDRTRLLRDGLQSARTQFSRGRLHQASRQLARLDTAGIVSDQLQSLRAEVDATTLMSELVIRLQSPSLRRFPEVLDSLRQRLRALKVDADTAQQRVAVELVADRVLGRGSAPALSPEVERGFPRLCFLLAQGERERPAAEAPGSPASLPANTTPLDHLLSVVVLGNAKETRARCYEELDRIAAPGAFSAAIHFARAVLHESAERFDAAYLELAPLTSEGSHETIAHALRARVAAKGRRGEVALSALDAADATFASRRGDSSLRSFLELTRLQIYLDLDGARTQRFWDTHRRLRGLLQDQPHYWLLAAYAHIEDALRQEPSAAKKTLLNARSATQRGLACQPRAAKAFSLRIADLQAGWLLSPHRDDPEPPDSLDQLERRRLEALRDAARQLQADASRSPSERVQAEAALVRARCSRMLGERRQAWQLLEDSCTRHRTSQALGEFVGLVTYRLLLHHLLGREADRDTGSAPAIDDSAWVARERALELLQEERLSPRLRVLAGHGAFACAYHLGKTAEALRGAAAILEQTKPGQAIHSLAELSLSAGGLRSGLTRTKDELLPALDQALEAIREGLSAGWLNRSKLSTIEASWRSHAWASRGSTELERRLQELRALREGQD